MTIDCALILIVGGAFYNCLCYWHFYW